MIVFIEMYYIACWDAERLVRIICKIVYIT
jgi:hypothetical protein